MKTSLSASILSADFAHLADQIRQAEDAGVDWIHIDVMDGMFVPNITMGPFIVETCRRITQLPLDVHLMIERPERYLQDFASAGACILSVHLEQAPHIYRTLTVIRELGCQAGLVLNPGTPAVLAEPLLPLADLVLCMSVNPGFSGQSFLPLAVEKVRDLRQACARQGLDPWLQVDGGMTAETMPRVVAAGANSFVAATAIFKHPGGIAAGVRALRDQFAA